MTMVGKPYTETIRAVEERSVWRQLVVVDLMELDIDPLHDRTSRLTSDKRKAHLKTCSFLFLTLV